MFNGVMVDKRYTENHILEEKRLHRFSKPRLCDSSGSLGPGFRKHEVLKSKKHPRSCPCFRSVAKAIMFHRFSKPHLCDSSGSHGPGFREHEMLNTEESKLAQITLKAMMFY